MKSNIILMNFKLPIDLKAQFKNCCESEYISMSTVLNLLIREYIDKFHTSSKLPLEQEPKDGT